MEINQIPSPQFMINEDGMFSLFLPAFEDDPNTPSLIKKDETTLIFRRSSSGEIDLTDINPEIMDALKKVTKLLVVETNVLKSIDLIDKVLEVGLKSDSVDANSLQKEMQDAIERAYEVDVTVL